MQYIGRWISFLTDLEFPPPQELVGDLAPTIRAAVVDYLRNGHQLNVFRGHSSCLFLCGHEEVRIDAGDGTWAWPLDYAHYVEAHGVLVPPEFCDQVVGASAIPDLDVGWRSEQHSLEFWRDWCEKNADRSLRPKISRALEEAKSELSQLVQRRAKELEHEYGLSNAICNWSDCSQRALSQRAFCGRCMLKGSEATLGAHLFDVRTVLGE